jgi:hypothetical protein
MCCDRAAAHLLSIRYMIINDLSAAAPKFIPWAMAGGATRRVYPLGLMPCRTRVLKSSAPAPREISKVRKKYVYLIIIVLCVEKKTHGSQKSPFGPLWRACQVPAAADWKCYVFSFYLFVRMSDLLGNPTTFRRVE